jgi:hypothetical protein
MHTRAVRDTKFELDRGEMLRVIGIWDDGWATGVRLPERAEDQDRLRVASTPKGRQPCHQHESHPESSSRGNKTAAQIELDRGEMLRVIGIWDDGWATGVRLPERAEDQDLNSPARGEYAQRTATLSPA